MVDVRFSITVVCLVFLGPAVSAPLPQGYYGPPVNYVPQPPYAPPPGFFPPQPNNMQFPPLPPPPPPPQMSLTDFSYQFQNTVNNPMPPMPAIGPNDLGKPMPLEAAAAAQAPASSYGPAQAEQEIEATGSTNAIYTPPRTSLLDSYYNGRPGATGGMTDNMFGGLVGAYVMKEYIF